MKKSRKLYKRLLIILALIYVMFTLVNQQKTINQYSDNSKELAIEIKKQEEYKEELIAKKENVNSEEYIEETAREKLDMYLQNEKVYIDTGI